MNKFKVGQKVRVVHKTTIASRNHNSKLGEIVEFKKDYYRGCAGWYKLTLDGESQRCEEGFWEDELELVEEEPTPNVSSDSTFKVGDRVHVKRRITNKTGDGKDNFDGVIEDIDKPGCIGPYLIRDLEENSYQGFFFDDELTLLPKEEHPGYQEDGRFLPGMTTKDYGLKKGDKVVWADPYELMLMGKVFTLDNVVNPECPLVICDDGSDKTGCRMLNRFRPYDPDKDGYIPEFEDKPKPEIKVGTKVRWKKNGVCGVVYYTPCPGANCVAVMFPNHRSEPIRTVDLDYIAPDALPSLDSLVDKVMAEYGPNSTLKEEPENEYQVDALEMGTSIKPIPEDFVPTEQVINNNKEDNNMSTSTKYFKQLKDAPELLEGAVVELPAGSSVATPISDLWNVNEDATVTVSAEALENKDFYTRVYKVHVKGEVKYVDREAARKHLEKSVTLRSK